MFIFASALRQNNQMIIQWILILPSSLSLSYFCFNLPYSLLMRLIGRLFNHITYNLLFCFVLSIFFFNIMGPYSIVLNCYQKDSVSLVRFTFLSHGQVLSHEISFVLYLKYPNNCFYSNVLFSSYCCSVDYCLVCIVFPRCN